MKKVFAAILSAIMLCLAMSGAMASTDFFWHGNDTVNFHAWGPSQQSTGSNWHITWTEANMTNSLRAAVRIYAAPGTYSSSLYVYSLWSGAYHPYYSGFGDGGAYTYIAGRVDNRDVGILHVKGVFYN